MSHRTPLLAWAALLLAGHAASAQVSNPPPPVPRPRASAPATSDRAMPGEIPRRVIKSDAQWARELTRDQFLVTRRKETEPAFSGRLLHNKAKGVYACVCCDAPLFTSRTKFDSGTGWPSFYAPVDPRSVTNEPDHSYGQERVEVVCSTCGAHLGHVFDDGPPPTGLRYCMNSVSLRFYKDSPADAKTKAKSAKDAGKGAAKADPAPAAESPGAKAPDATRS